MVTAMLRGCFLESVNCACCRLGVLCQLDSGLSTASSRVLQAAAETALRSLSCFSNLKGSQQLVIERRRHIWELLLEGNNLAAESRTPATPRPSSTVNSPERAWASRRTCPGRAKIRSRSTHPGAIGSSRAAAAGGRQKSKFQ